MQIRIDWAKIGYELRLSGLNSTQVAALCGSTQPVVHKIFSGHTKNPTYPLGQALIDLFGLRCPGKAVPEALSEVREPARTKTEWTATPLEPLPTRQLQPGITDRSDRRLAGG